MNKGKDVERAIQRLMASECPRAKSLVVTVFGDSIAPHGGAVWLGQLADLLAPFGIGERLVRSSVFRLVRDGWLEAHRRGRRSLYMFTPSGNRRFERAHQKIYARSADPWNGEWTVVFASRLASQRRAQLRRELEWEGFRLLSQGTYLRPAGDILALSEILDRLGSRAGVVACSARDIPLLKTQSLDGSRKWLWDLTSVGKRYRRFIAQFSPIAKLTQDSASWSPETAFIVRTLLIHSFRRVLLHDPLLPAELLPEQWAGNDAYTLCRDIYRKIYGTAEKRIHATLAEDLLSASGALDVFYSRFGGLP